MTPQNSPCLTCLITPETALTCENTAVSPTTPENHRDTKQNRRSERCLCLTPKGEPNRETASPEGHPDRPDVHVCSGACDPSIDPSLTRPLEVLMCEETTQPAPERLAEIYDRDYPNGECVPGPLTGRCVRITHDHDRAVS